MKIYASFKTPDVIDNTIEDFDTDEEGEDRIRQVMEKFVSYGEIIMIEFDMTTQTARVVSNCE